MFIKKLEVQGFKSFADRTKILFHPGITAIVGPNGTGKSNIVDGILWVLGGLRLKSVRGDRTEDFIFNGNAKRPPLSMADGVITLGNEEELVISHRVFRSGESEYRLNGKAVRLKDIQDELWKHSIGEKEYFVIEQGAIGSFVTSKPQEKRLLIEEAAGTAYYKDKKRQAQNKLESSEQNLIRLEDIIIEVEKSKNSLYRQALAAARVRRLRERQRELVTHHYYRRMRQLEKSLEEIQASLQQADSREQEALEAVRAEEKELARKRKELWDLEKVLKDRQERTFSLKSQLSRLEGEIERESKRLEYLETSRQKAETDRVELQNEIKALEEEKTGTIVRLTELQKALETTTVQVEEKRAALEEAARLTAAEEELLSGLRREQMQKIQEATEIRNNFYRLEKELELVLKAAEKIEREKEDYLTQKQQVENRLASLQAELNRSQEEKELQQSEQADLSRELNSLSQKLTALEENLTRLNRKIEEKGHQLQALEKIAEVERESADRQPAPGALGWFSELVEIQEEAAPLFDLFWKEEARAQAILLEKFKENIPLKDRQTLLLLSEKSSRAVPDSLLQAEGVLGLLKQKIKAKSGLERHTSSLSEAVIVNDVLTAVRLWEQYPELNFITVGGDLLQSSGLLKTGQKKEGLFTLSQEKRRLLQELQSLEAEKEPLLKEIESAAENRALLEKKLEEAGSRLQQSDKKISDLERENKFVRLELQKISTALEILEKEEKIQQQEKEALQRQREEAQGGLQATESGLEEIKQKIKEREETLNLVKENHRAEEEKAYQLRSEFNLLQEKINNSRNSLQSLERRQQAITAKLGILEMEVYTGQEEKERLAGLIEELKQKAFQLETEARKEEEGLAEQDRLVPFLQKELEEMEARLAGLRSEEEKAREEKTRLEIRRAEAERDRVNLEETCWQELKKNLLELKQEIETEGGETRPGAESEELARALAEEGDEAEEEAPEKPEEKPEAKPEERTEEKPKERRRGKPPVPARELGDEDLERELEAVREALQRLRQVNMMAEEEYLEQKKRYDFLIQQRQDLRDSIDSTQEAIKKIDEESKTQFLKALEEVNKNFQEIFTLLFRGGTAEVKLLEPENPLESGVEIVAQPPGKRVQNLTLLSGGEKSLTSLAFLFALFRYKPSPFCILDEVDAALDEVNLGRFLNLMKAIKHQTQFIIITHNYKTMEVADYIYGTTMEEPNVTRVYSVRMERKEAASPEEEPETRTGPAPEPQSGGQAQKLLPTTSEEEIEPIEEPGENS
ncbi:MAG: chromosome segregation protein SMC [Candidatus Saccharicenans sp.]|nr:chromosome segregation protein SMC [Candidatus Saccharicenans sp.]MDI6849888.1 chromosome segregation protein SMC [Candidatus Saccharicenans sp.]